MDCFLLNWFINSMLAFDGYFEWIYLLFKVFNTITLKYFELPQSWNILKLIEFPFSFILSFPLLAGYRLASSAELKWLRWRSKSTSSVEINFLFIGRDRGFALLPHLWVEAIDITSSQEPVQQLMWCLARCALLRSMIMPFGFHFIRYECPWDSDFLCFYFQVKFLLLLPFQKLFISSNIGFSFFLQNFKSFKPMASKAVTRGKKAVSCDVTVKLHLLLPCNPCRSRLPRSIGSGLETLIILMKFKAHKD